VPRTGPLTLAPSEKIGPLLIAESLRIASALRCFIIWPTLMDGDPENVAGRIHEVLFGVQWPDTPRIPLYPRCGQ